MLLTTAVLAILTAYSGAVGDAALRHAPAGPRNAADTALIVKADVPEEGRRKADAAVREGARETFGGLPITVRTLTRSGPYALPATPRPRGEDAEGGKDGEDGDDPDLTYFAALDPAQVRVVEGRPPATSGERNDGQHTGRNAGRPPAHDGPDPLPGPAPAGPGVAPQAVLAAAGGALTGWATVRLLAPGVDLTAIALRPPRPRWAGPDCAPTRGRWLCRRWRCWWWRWASRASRRGGRAAAGRSPNCGRGTRGEAGGRRDRRAAPGPLAEPWTGGTTTMTTSASEPASSRPEPAPPSAPEPVPARTPASANRPATLAELADRATASRDRPACGHDALITCDRLVRIFSADGVEVQALQGLDLLVREGDLMALVGASGSGRSTLMNILAGLDSPTAGAARMAGRDLLSMTAKDRLAYRREVVGFVWQQTARNLLPYLTAAQNIALPLQLAGSRAAKDRRVRTERALELLELLDIADCRDRRPGQLSRGQQQRVAIAVALANHPSVLLADEPTGELDSHTAEQIFAAFRTANERLGTTVVIVTHDQAVAGEVRRTVAIRDGRTSTEVLRRSEVDAATATRRWWPASTRCPTAPDGSS